MKIHYQVYGEGEPLVLLHGWAMHSGIWRDFAEQLAQTFQVICIDLPGHGLSDEIEAFTLESVCTHLKTIAGGRACWVGWSLGGAVALQMAKQFPEVVASVVLLASNPCFVKKRDWPGMRAPILDGFGESLKNDCEATLLRFTSLQISGLPGFKKLSKQLTATLRECALPSEKTLQEGLSILRQADLRPVFSDIRAPIAAILGDKDTLVPVEVGEAMQKLNPQSHLSIIKDSGHAPFLTHDRELLSIFKDFLARV